MVFIERCQIILSGVLHGRSLIVHEASSSCGDQYIYDSEDKNLEKYFIVVLSGRLRLCGSARDDRDTGHDLPGDRPTKSGERRDGWEREFFSHSCEILRSKSQPITFCSRDPHRLLISVLGNTV